MRTALRDIVRAFDFDGGSGFVTLRDGTDCGFKGSPVLVNDETPSLAVGEFRFTSSSEGNSLRLGLGKGMTVVFEGVTIL